MSAAGELFEHAVGVITGARLTENFVVEGDDSVRGDDNSWAHGARGDELGFGIRESENESGRRFIGRWGFVDGGSKHGERNAGVAQNLGAAGRGRGEDEFHVRPFERRIVQGVLLDDDGFVILAEDFAEGVGDFADGGVGFDGSEDGGKKIVGGTGAAL